MVMSFKYVDYVKAQKRIAPFTSRIIGRTLMEVDRRLERHRRHIKKIEDARRLSNQRFDALPSNATIRKEYVKCGKDSCEMSHGPYYYAYWKEKVPTGYTTGVVWRLKKKYIGSYLPEYEEQTEAAKLRR